ncbi:MAG: hypothetical protein HXX09_15060 [Bacteroidetes bacterium]|nr:hypothetical protein [Bacteroidota bacterium]
MKNRFFNLTTLSILFVITLAFNNISCNKDESDKDQLAAQNNSDAENAFSDVFKQIDIVSKDTTLGVLGTINISCATVTMSPIGLTYPKTITIDYGTTNCEGTDGRFRRGKIIAVTTGKYRDSLTSITVTFDNYFLNDNKVFGTKTITNKGRNTLGNMFWTIKVENAGVITEKGTIAWNSVRTREWIAGENTLNNYFDDGYSITGNGSGVTTDGNSFVITITKALKASLSCMWLTCGTVEITPQGLSTRIIDFGNGTCDREATVLINDETYNIVLK